MINNNHETSKVPEGYKQTEVGIIPDDWDMVKIGDLCNIFGRIGYRGYTKADIVSSDVGVLSISPSNIFGGKLDYSSGTYITLDKYNESPEIKIYEGDVLLVKTGSTYGKVGLVKGLMQKATLNPQVVVLKDRKCPDALLAYLMQFELVRNQIEKTIVGGAIPTLSQKEVSEYLVPIAANKQEQTAIANALSDVDALIAELEKLIAKKEAIKTGAMQQLLTGRTRLPQFAKREDGTPKGYKQSELGEIPEDWRGVSISDIAEISMGQSPNSSNYNKSGEGLPLVQGNADIYKRETIIRNYTSEITKRADLGDLILSVRAPVGEVAIASFDCCIGRGVCSLKYPNNYLYHWLVFFEDKWEQFSKGSTFDSINSEDLKKIELIIPNSNEQIAIAEILSDMDSELEALEKLLDKTKALKQGMMQELLTGRTRLV